MIKTTLPKGIKKKAELIKEALKQQVAIQTANISIQANSNRPSYEWGSVTIFDSISDSGLTGTIMASDAANPDMAVYFEVGTGADFLARKSSYSAEVIKLATQYYKNGKGTIKAHPYLFPAYYKYRKEFLKNIRKEVKKILL